MLKPTPSVGLMGLGSRSTLFYLQQLNQRAFKSKGGYSTFPLVLINADFNTINPHLPSRFDQLEPPVQALLDRFEALGVEQLIIPNITLHETVDRLSPQMNIIHPVKLTLEAFRESEQIQGIIFGSKYTMVSDVIRNRFTAADIHLVAPKTAEQIQLDDFRKKVYAGLETPRDIDEFQALIATYAERGNVVIACTELSIFVPDNVSNVFDMVQLQLEAVVKEEN